KIRAELQRTSTWGEAGAEVLDMHGLIMGGCFYTAQQESLYCFKVSVLTSMFSGHFPLKTNKSRACIIDCDKHSFKYTGTTSIGRFITSPEEADHFGIPYTYSLCDYLATEMETYSLRLRQTSVIPICKN
uniref:Uncharacterized protein n=1 Tax=Mus spicilegus TaxID=10103 RepID=A0A8C6G8R4_MUSSI